MDILNNKLWVYFPLVSLTTLFLPLLFLHKQAYHGPSRLQGIIQARKYSEEYGRGAAYGRYFIKVKLLESSRHSVTYTC